LRLWLLLIAMASGAVAAAAAPVSQLQVRVVTGAEDLTAGSVLELRIYEVGRPVRHLPLSHGEAWPRDSTRMIPLRLTEPLDPRGVSRFSLYYHASSPMTPPLQIVAADVNLAPGHLPADRLLDATLSGEIARQGELATAEREAASLTCRSNADCDDHRNCNGQEHCAPRTPGADARGCVKGLPVSCPVNEICSEARGCVGPSAIAPQ
jgi:hypothetical protein